MASSQVPLSWPPVDRAMLAAYFQRNEVCQSSGNTTFRQKTFRRTQMKSLCAVLFALTVVIATPQALQAQYGCGSTCVSSCQPSRECRTVSRVRLKRVSTCRPVTTCRRVSYVDCCGCCRTKLVRSTRYVRTTRCVRSTKLVRVCETRTVCRRVSTCRPTCDPCARPRRLARRTGCGCR